MTAQSINGSVPVDFFFEDVKAGASGWFTGVECNAAQNRLCGTTDVVQGYVRLLSEVNWRPIFNLARMPARYANVRGQVPGAHGLNFAGNSDTRLFVGTEDGILRTDDFADNWSSTTISGLVTYPGKGHQRIFSQAKGLDHPTDQNFFFCSFQHLGMIGTRDGGVTRDDMSWLPRPSLPVAGGNTSAYFANLSRFTVSARNPDNPNQIAFAPSGEGVWLSNDNGVTGGKISNGNIINATDMTWRGGFLYVAKGADAFTNAGEPALLNPTNNLYRWSQATGWKHYNTGLSFANASRGVQFIWSDPRVPSNTPALLLLCETSEYIYTANVDDTATYRQSGGSNEGPQYRRTGPFINCKTRARPLIARKYRNGGGTGACSKPKTVGAFMYWPLGYGPLRTPVADFPTGAADYLDPFLNWPVMEEDTAGIEELVSVQGFAGSKLSFGLSHDFPFSAVPTREVGHEAVYSGFPGIGQLSTAVDAQQSPTDPDFIAFAAFKGGPWVGYSKDGGISRKLCPNQPHITNLAQGGPAGAIMTGGTPDRLVVFPGATGPEYTSDLGVTPWQAINVFLEDGTQINAGAEAGRYNKHGFHTAGSQNGIARMATIDENGTVWAFNIGAGRIGFPENDWETDGQGWGGVYRMTQADWGNLRRVSVGRPINWANWAYFRRNIIAVPGQNKIIIYGNSVDNEGFGNDWIVMDTVAPYTKRRVTNPQNFDAIDIGAPMWPGGPAAVWGLGWYRSNPADPDTAQYGLWLSFDLFLSAPIGPFNSRAEVKPGMMKNFAASKVEPGKIVAAIDGLGHVVGRLRQV